MMSRKILLILFSALLLGVTILVTNNLSPVPDVAAANRSISLTGTVSGWNFSTTANPTITVNQGDVVTISLSSSDVTHQFALDVDKDGPKFTGLCSTGDTCSNNFFSGSPTSVVINVNFSPGTYTYFCTFHSAMVGSFVVNSTSVGGTVGTPNVWTLVVAYLVAASALAAVVATVVYMRRGRRSSFQ